MAIPVYSKEELFILMQLAKSRGLSIDINLHKFPILEVIKGERDVFAIYTPMEGLGILLLESNTAPEILKRRNLTIVSMPEFFRCMNVDLNDFFKIAYKNRKFIYSPNLDSGIVEINSIRYPIPLVEEIIEIPFNEFLLNLEYELSLTMEQNEN